MIVDTSAIISVLKGEPDAGAFALAMENADSVRMSAATYMETFMVMGRFQEPILGHRFQEMIQRRGIVIEPVSFEQADIARKAYRDYGKGSGHRAQLNFGDCFSYALARVTREPILYKGDDFRHTDLRSAL